MEHLLRKKPILFIGGINLKNKATGGQEAKNQQIIAYLNRHNMSVKIIDTFNWKRRILIILFKIIKATLFTKNQNIYLSLSYQSNFKLLQLLNLLKVTKRNRVFYIVIGGVLHDWLEENPQNIKSYKTLSCIYPESVVMVNSLNKSGLTNVKQLPNFKLIPQVKINKTYKKIKFVFLSRIVPTKGVDLIIEASEKLNAKNLTTPFSVSFYGNFDNDNSPNYQSTFLSRIDAIPNINYKGFINLKNIENYNTLSNYNVMLFPTFWKGEGYPGVLIDAFISQLPVIASDWHHNKEIVQTDINGILIKPKSVDELTNAMQRLIEDVVYLKSLETGAKKSTEIYDIEKILPPIFESIYVNTNP